MPDKLIIDNEFQALIPPLTNNKLETLKDSLTLDGCSDSLDVWRTKDPSASKSATTMGTAIDIILDDHNRYDIRNENNIKFNIYQMWFPARAEALAWIIKNHFARRNLDTVQRKNQTQGLTTLSTRVSFNRARPSFNIHRIFTDNPPNTRSMAVFRRGWRPWTQEH